MRTASSSFTDLLTTGDAALLDGELRRRRDRPESRTPTTRAPLVAVAAGEGVTTGARVVWVNCLNLLLSTSTRPSPAATRSSGQRRQLDEWRADDRRDQR